MQQRMTTRDAWLEAELPEGEESSLSAVDVLFAAPLFLLQGLVLWLPLGTTTLSCGALLEGKGVGLTFGRWVSSSS